MAGEYLGHPRNPYAKEVRSASAKSVLAKLLTENGYMLGSEYGDRTRPPFTQPRTNCEITKREHVWLDRFTEERSRTA